MKGRYFMKGNMTRAMRREISRNIEDYPDFYQETYPEEENYG